jgi:uncharacterized protein
MIDVTVRRIDSIAPERWRNGGGVTRTVAQSGDDWRVSIAEIERDGPYSRFDGITRISLVLRGHGVVLRDDDDVVTLEPFEVVQYDGGAAWQATLVDGPSSALNVMTRNGVCRARVQAIVQTVTPKPGCTAIIVAPDGACRCDDIVIDAQHVAVIENVAHAMHIQPMHGTSFLITLDRVTQ